MRPSYRRRSGSRGPPRPAPPGRFENTTFNFAFDGYYGFNFNSPIGRTNLLRAYDVSSNSFSLNQADVVIENAADPAQGRHFGARVDLQFGQATQTLQGSADQRTAARYLPEYFPGVWNVGAERRS